ncbi:MAG: hypothetical protein AB8I08_20615 [Sandaracinaceae bacterium]
MLEATAAIDALLRGEFTLANALRQRDPQWALPVGFARWSAGLDDAPPTPSAAEIAVLCARSPVAGAMASRRWALSAVLRGDTTLLERETSPSPTAEAWRALMRGQSVGRVPEDDASPDGMAIRVDRVVFRALDAMASGDWEAARTSARQAFRMARAEGLPQSQYLAGLVLARYRRLSSHPDLALRIVRGLARVAPAAWRRWIGWEAVLSGGRNAADLLGQLPPASPARGLMRLLSAAHVGDRAAFDAEAAALTESVVFAPFARDLERVVSAVDPRVRLPPEHELYALRNTSEPLPLGLAGLSMEEGPAPSAALCAAPGKKATRIVFAGAGLFVGPEQVRAAVARKRVGRTEAGLATLALAGPDGLEEADFFLRLYGLVYDRAIHRGVLGVLVQRMRQWLGDAADIERSQRLVLRPKRPFVIPDSKTARALSEQVTRFLAKQDAASAKEAGASLGVSLRSAQQALTELVEDGACERVKSGRKTHYVLTDTTFQDPTGEFRAG